MAIDPMAEMMEREELPPAGPEMPEPAIADEVRSESLLDDMRERLCDTFSTYRDWRSTNMEPLWNATYEAYHGMPPADNYPYGSFYCIREIFRQVEALKPMLSARMMPTPKLFRYQPVRAGQDFDNRADAATQLVHYQIERYRQRSELQRWLDNVGVWGTSYLMVGWKEYQRRPWKLAKLSTRDYPHKTAWERKTEEIPEAGPHMRWLDHWSVYTDWRADRFEDAPITYVYDAVTAEYVKTLVREGELDAKAVKEALDDAPMRTEHAWGPDQLRSKGEFDDGPNKDGMYPLVTCYTNDGWVATLLNDKVVRCQRNHLGWLPIIELRDYPQPGEHYGLGEPGIMLWEQQLLNDAASMWVDSVHFGLNPMMVARKDQEKNINLLSYKPGGILYVDGDPKEAIQPLQVNNTTFQLDGAMNAIRTNMQLVSGMTDAALGESKHRTATGIVRLQDAAQARIDHKITWMLPQFKMLYSRLYELNARFMDGESIIRVQGENGKEWKDLVVGPQHFEPEADVVIELPAEQLNPAEERMKYIQLWQLIAQDPRFKVEAVQERLLRAFDIPQPEKAIARPAYAQKDAMREQMEWAASGITPEPSPHDDHQTHLMIHQMFMQTDDFRAAPPQWQQLFMNHLTWHGEMLRQITGQAQQSSQQSVAPMGAGDAVPGTSAQTETMFGNAQRGAAQQGAMPLA